MIAGILTVVYGLLALYIYHKVFSVIYFDLAHGCLVEIVVCGIIGMIFALLTMTFWYIAIPLAIIIIVILVKKHNN